MAVKNAIGDLYEKMKAHRHFLHQNPELGFETKESAAYVTARLLEMGITDIHQGFAQHGVIAVIDGKADGRVIGLRADMDALPIEEKTGLPYASQVVGKMHACGHDGHTAMLLGAAEYLAANRDFAGKVVLVFQPAEEGGGGAGVMVQEGVLKTFGIEEIYALHNLPNAPFGHFEFAKGATMASTDTFDITIEGQGGHAAFPETTIDPIPIAMNLVNALYTFRARGVSGQSPAVISVTQFHAGSADNIVPQSVFIQGTVRTLDAIAREKICNEIKKLAQSIPESFGAKGQVRIYDGYPVTVNSEKNVDYACAAAAKVVGAANVFNDRPPEMGAEDFAFFLEACDGAYGFLGAGPGADLHNDAYDFNDELLPYGASFFAEIVETRLGRV